MSHSDPYERYEAGLRTLLEQLGSEHDKYTEALTYQQRLQENIDHTRLYGDTEERKAGRAEIIRRIDTLTASTLQTTFLTLCQRAIPSPDTPTLATLPTAAIPDPAPLPCGSRMPLHHNPRFVGREADLHTLARLFKGGTTTQAIATVATAATGMGGIGKTQLASEFVHRYGHYFAGGVFWLSFADPANIPAEVALCGGPDYLNLDGITGLSVDEQAQRVCAAWRSDLPRLLVFDNCEDVALLHTWQPTSGGCRILLTSRNPTWDEAPGVRRLALDVLAREESVALLRGSKQQQGIGYRGEGVGEQQQGIGERGEGVGSGEQLGSDGRMLSAVGILPDDPAFDAIAAELGDLPLALHLAGSYLYLFRNDIKPAEYLAELRAERVLSHESLHGTDVKISYTEHDLNVEITFRKSYDEKLKLDPATPRDAQARALLARMACVAPGEPVPRALLLESIGITDDTTARRHAARALHRLTSLGMLDAEGDGALRMHRLLAHFVRQAAPDDTAQAAVEQTMLETAERLNEAGDPRPLLVLQPHLRHITDTASPRGDEQAANLCNTLGYHLQMTGDYAGTRPYYERALAIRDAVLGATHPATATSLNNLGLLLYAMGDLAGTRPYLERALAIYEAVLGATHPNTAQSLNNLGMLLMAMGDLAGARPYLKRALAINEAVLGATHPATATSLNNMGALLRAMGDLAGAKPYLERTLAIWDAVLGTTHPNTAGSLNNLGALLQAMGDLAGAKPYLERALAIWDAVLGATHPDTATSLNNLGMVLKDMGDLAGARPYLERALAIWEAVLGATHPDTALSLNNMGGLLQAMGDLAGAKPYYERALAIYEAVLGATHSDTALSLNNLGGLLRAMGDLAGARPYYERALAICEAVLGATHPATAQSLNNMGTLLQAMGDLAGARPYYERALAIQEAVLGETHLDTALSLNNLAILCYDEQEYAQVARLMRRALHICETVLGHEHPYTVVSRRWIALIEEKLAG